MKNKKLLTVILSALFAGSLSAQVDYNIINGPSDFMRLNPDGKDFDSFEISASGQGYTFYHSYWDIECPWSVVSENGTNIYTKLDFSKVSNVKSLFILTPELELDADKAYTFSQHVFGIAQDDVQPVCAAKLELKLLQGKVADFHPDSLGDVPSLSFGLFYTSDDKEFKVEQIKPEANGTYYFALCVTYFGVYPGNTKAMSLGFKNNTVTDNSTSGIAKVSKVPFKVIPNPTRGELRLKNYTGSLEILDVSGKKVYQNADYNGGMLDLSFLRSGIYLLGNNGNYVKIIKN